MDSILIQNPIIALIVVVGILFQLFARYNAWSAVVFNVIGFVITMVGVLMLVLYDAKLQEIALVLIISLTICMDGFRREGDNML